MKNIVGFIIALKGHQTDVATINTYLPNVKVFDAIDTRNTDLQRLPVHPGALAGIKKTYFSDSFQVPSKGAIGCALSHYAVWERCLALRAPIVVFEEDVVFDRDTASSILNGLDTLPPDTMYASLMGIPSSVWHVASPDRALENSPYEGWYKAGLGMLGTQCYYIAPAGARILLQHAYPVCYQVDIYIAFVAYTNPSFTAYRTKHNPYSIAKCLADFGASTIGYGKMSVKMLLPESNWVYALVLLFLVIYVAKKIVA